jgi:putative membrane protein
LGATNIVPGISGGTIAVLLNIYDKILYSISLVNIKKNLTFLAPLGLGVVCGIFSFSKLITVLLDRYEMIMYFCFIGLIMGSVPMIYRRAKYEKIKPQNAVIFACALVFMIVLAFAYYGSPANKTLAQLGGVSPSLLAWLFFAAFLSTVVMILPGISGSLMLLLLGAYVAAIEALSTLNAVLLGAMGTGVLLGAFVGVKFVKKMLRFHPQALYCAILGLVIGSVFTIYPGFSQDIAGVLSILFMCAFAVFTYLFSKKSNDEEFQDAEK